MYKATLGLKTDMDPKVHKTCMDKLKAMIHKKHPELKFREFIVNAQGHVKTMDEALKGGKKKCCCGGGMTRPTLVHKDGIYSLEYKGRIIANSTDKAEMVAELNKISSALKKGATFPHEKSDEGEYDFEAEMPKKPYVPRVSRTNYKLDLLDKDDLSGKSKYSKVAIGVMKGQLSKQDATIFKWLKRQALNGATKEGVMDEMTRKGIPESKQIELMQKAVDKLVAEGKSRHV
jgi:hypothetical protein